MKVTVNVADLLAGIDATAEQIREGLEAGVRDAALQMEAAAKANLKGDARGKHLMSSIHTEVQAEGDSATAQIGVGGATGIDGDAGEMFGIFVHEGTGIYSRTGMGRKDVPWFYMDDQGEGHQTSGMQANPFMENAYNEVGPKAPEIVAKEILKMGGGG